MKNAFEITLLICLSSAVALGAAIDCSKAATRTEKMICSNAKLSSADEQLSKLFNDALAASTDKQPLRREQKEWLASQRDVCPTAACMLDAYSARTERLKSILDGGATETNHTVGAAPFLVIKAVPETAGNKTGIDNGQTGPVIEVSGTIEFGHDAAGGNYFVDGGKNKHHTLGYVWEIDDATQNQLSQLADSRTKVTVSATTRRWKDGSISFDSAQSISIFK